MSMSLWQVSSDEWAVCEGADPEQIAGHISRASTGAWVKKGPSSPQFLDRASAAAHVLGRDVPIGWSDYVLARGNEIAAICTYPDICETIKEQGGWVLVMK